VTRALSPSELVAALVVATESEDESDQELQQLLVVHSSPLAEALSTSLSRVEALRTMAPEPRRKRARELVRAAKEQHNTAQVSAKQNLAMAAASMLARLARWEAEGVVLDERIVLGRSLLGDRTRRYVRFDVEGIEPVVIHRNKLADAAKALRFSDLCCSLDRRGLRFGWHAGKGGLLLVSQRVEARYRDAVLSVVIERARPRAQLGVAPTPERTSSWVGDVFSELGVF
jgi:hypothetical protein